MDSDWQAFRNYDGKIYYYSKIRNESIWEKPNKLQYDIIINDPIHWKCYSDAAQSNRKYYVHSITNEKSWECPPGCHMKQPINEAWVAFVSLKNERYYYNRITHETSWETPSGGEKLPVIGQSTEIEIEDSPDAVVEHEDEDEEDEFYVPDEDLITANVITVPGDSNIQETEEVASANTAEEDAEDDHIQDSPEQNNNEDEANVLEPVVSAELEARMNKLFFELLEEKGIQPFSQWSESWVQKLGGDPRFESIAIEDRALLFRQHAKSLIGKEKALKKRRIDRSLEMLEAVNMKNIESIESLLEKLNELRHKDVHALRSIESIMILDEKSRIKVFKKWKKQQKRGRS